MDELELIKIEDFIEANKKTQFNSINYMIKPSYSISYTKPSNAFGEALFIGDIYFDIECIKPFFREVTDIAVGKNADLNKQIPVVQATIEELGWYEVAVFESKVVAPFKKILPYKMESFIDAVAKVTGSIDISDLSYVCADEICVYSVDKNWQIESGLGVKLYGGLCLNLKYIQIQMGHANPTITLNIYAHLMKPANQ